MNNKINNWRNPVEIKRNNFLHKSLISWAINPFVGCFDPLIEPVLGNTFRRRVYGSDDSAWVGGCWTQISLWPTGQLEKRVA